MAFAAVAQLAPAFFGGLMWRRATAGGALAGMIVGILVWAYTLLLPSLTDAARGAHSAGRAGPFGIGLLRPQACSASTCRHWCTAWCGAFRSTSSPMWRFR